MTTTRKYFTDNGTEMTPAEALAVVKRAIFTAASKAQEAADFLVDAATSLAAAA